MTFLVVQNTNAYIIYSKISKLLFSLQSKLMVAIAVKQDFSKHLTQIAYIVWVFQIAQVIFIYAVYVFLLFSG